jgi:Cytochrome P460
MRRTLLAVVLIASLSAVIVVVAAAEPSANGLPSYTNGYPQWQKVNRRPITGGSPAHRGTKNVYASKSRAGKRYPNGTVIVKTVARRGDARTRPSQVALMRKGNGRWRFVEYALSGSRYTVLAQGQLCVSCHVQAKASDYVFTNR